MPESVHTLPPQTLEYMPRPADREIRMPERRPGLNAQTVEKGD